MFVDNYDFNSLIKRSEARLNKRPKEPLFIKNYIFKLNNYIQNIKKSNPDLTLEELNKILDNDFFEILDTIFNNDSTLFYVMAYESCIYLSSCPKKFQEILQQIKDDPNQIPENYGNDFNSNLKVFVSEVKEAYDSFMDDENFKEPSLVLLKEKLLDSNISVTEKNKICNHVYSQLNFSDKNYIKKYINCIKNEEFGFLQYETNFREDNLKENLISSISSVGKQLQKLGLLEKYPNYQEGYFKKIGVSNFVHPVNSNKNTLGIDRLSNPNYLSTLSFDSLLALNNYWCNRFTKESDTYIESIFIIKQLNLLPQMLDGSFNIDNLPIADIESVLLKMNFLYAPTKNYWHYACKLDTDKIDITYFEDKDYHLLSCDDLKYSLLESVGKEYSDYFNNLLPNNDLKDDLDDYWKLYTPILNAYSFKDSSFLSTLALTKNLQLSPNYGIVIDGDFPSFPEESKYYQINFWMDFKGLNFPLREHIPLNTLKNFLKEYYGNCKLPLYMGSEAFTGIPSHILFPFNKNQISIIKNAKKNNYEGYGEKATNLLKHSSFLLNPKSAKKDVETIFFDLESFKFYTKGKDDNYIESSLTLNKNDSDNKNHIEKISDSNKENKTLKESKNSKIFEVELI